MKQITDEQTFKAAADLSAKLNYLCKFSADNTVALCAAATDPADGVIISAEPGVGGAVRVGLGGKIPVVSDGSGTAIAAGDWVGPNAAGKAVKKATADFSVCGRAQQPSTADGTVIEIQFTGPGFFRTAAG